MYKVKKLDDALKNLEGEDLNTPDGEKLSLKKVLVNQLGGYKGTQARPATGEQLIKAYDIGLKIHSAKGVVEMDDDQAKFVTQVLSETPMYPAVVMGQSLKLIENGKVVEKEEKK